MIEHAPSETPPSAGDSNPAAGKAKRSFFAVSAALFAVSLVFAGYLRFQIWNYASDTESLRREITEFDSKISTLRADPVVGAADLMSRNKASLENDIVRSQAQKYVDELMRLHRDYGVDFDGFNFAAGKVSTVVSASSSMSSAADPVDKIVKFIGDFRSNTGSAATSSLRLGEVRLVTGDTSKRAFNVEFKIK